MYDGAIGELNEWFTNLRRGVYTTSGEVALDLDKGDGDDKRSRAKEISVDL